MAERDPSVPQSDDPELQAEIVRTLAIVGPLGRFNVLDTIVPTFSMGQAASPEVEARQPAFRSTDVFTNGLVVAPGAGDVLADTGQLADGIYDIGFMCASNSSAGFNQSINIEHRNAANAATLAIWNHLMMNNVDQVTHKWQYWFAYELATDERLRAVTENAGTAARYQMATIFARRRT